MTQYELMEILENITANISYICPKCGFTATVSVTIPDAQDRCRVIMVRHIVVEHGR